MSFLVGLITAVFLFASSAASAEDSCAVSSIKLLAEGKREQLAARFKSQPEVLAQLEGLAAKVGGISEIGLVNAPRFKEHMRIGVGKPGSSYVGAWVNAKAERLGDVQFHIAMSSKEECELLALYVDFIN